MKTIICIGDSNTYGYDPRSYIGSRYPADVRWTDRLREISVINCGVNGMTVPRGRSRFAAVVRANDADLITVMLGTNDLCSGLSAEEITDRMDRFLDTISIPGKPILLIAPPHLQFGEWVMDEDAIEESHELGDRYRELAKKRGCLFADSGKWNIDVTFDGVHLSEEGHAAFAEKLDEVLRNIPDPDLYGAERPIGHTDNSSAVKTENERMKTENDRVYMEDDAGRMVAEITFPETSEGVFTIDHTFVDKSLRGQGIAAKLVQAAVDEIEKRGGKVEATCPYAVKWLEKKQLEKELQEKEI